MLILSIMITTPVFAEKLNLTYPKVKNNIKSSQILSTGFASFRNGVKIPVFTIKNISDTDLSGNPSINCLKEKCYFPMEIEPNIAKNMKIYIYSYDQWILVPKEWNNIEAIIGGNGNTVFSMSSPDQKSVLSMYDIPACFGCAITSASAYFPTASKYKAFYIKYDSSNVPLNIVRPNDHTVYYEYQLPGKYKINGIARFYPESDNPFTSLKVGLPENQKKVARAMLNFYALTHRN